MGAIKGHCSSWKRPTRVIYYAVHCVINFLFYDFYLRHFLFVHAIVHYYDIRCFTRFYLDSPSDRLIAAIKFHPISSTKMTRARNHFTQTNWQMGQKLRKRFTQMITQQERLQSEMRQADVWTSWKPRLKWKMEFCSLCVLLRVELRMKQMLAHESMTPTNLKRKEFCCDNGKVTD